MNIQKDDNQLVRLKDYQKTQRLKTEEIAKKLKITSSLLYKLYKNERSLQKDVYDRIEILIKNSQESTYQHGVEITENYVAKRVNTYQADTFKLPEFIGESPEIVFMKKLEYLTYIGKMRADGMLDEEEFVKIKSRLINLF